MVLSRRSGAITTLRLTSKPLRRGLDGGGPGELGPGRPVDPAEPAGNHGVQPRVLTLHSDRGAPMTSQLTSLTSRHVEPASGGMTTRFPRLSSEVIPRFPDGSGIRAKPRRSVDRSSGTMPSTAMAADANPRAPRRSGLPAGNPCSAKHGPLIPNASQRCAEAQTAGGSSCVPLSLTGSAASRHDRILRLP